MTNPYGQVRGMHSVALPRLDPERRRRRIELIAELSDAKAVRERVASRRIRIERLRDLIAARRRHLN